MSPADMRRDEAAATRSPPGDTGIPVLGTRNSAALPAPPPSAERFLSVGHIDPAGKTLSRNSGARQGTEIPPPLTCIAALRLRFFVFLPCNRG